MAEEYEIGAEGSIIGDEAWDELRRWHDQALRACFDRHGGEEVDHAGDGFFVSFPDAAAAMRARLNTSDVTAPAPKLR